jgi:hypothetical protein
MIRLPKCESGPGRRPEPLSNVCKNVSGAWNVATGASPVNNRRAGPILRGGKNGALQ